MAIRFKQSRFLLPPLAVLLAVVLALLITHSGDSAKASLAPVVHFTGRPPTGYTVTFRYHAGTAKSVQIEGEWYFSSPAHTSWESSQGVVPSKWKPGDFPIGWPNTSVTAGWPTVAMVKNRATGVWSYTTPLPSGDFNYGFIINCPTSVGCAEVSDPSNPAWNDHDGVSKGSVEPTSQVYVPSDPAFHTVNYWWEEPTSPRGALIDVSYPAIAPDLLTPGRNYLAIYTPPGYNSRRNSPYPTIYLNAGYSSNEVDWSTRADAANILDNLIDKQAIRPVVVVMTQYSFYDCLFGPSNDEAAQTDASLYAQNLLQRVIPYVEAHYDVSRKPSQRAFAGLSCGGGLAGSLLTAHTSQFGYYGVMSPYPPNLETLSAAQSQAIRKVGVLLGGGKDDPIHAYAAEDQAGLRRAGVKALIDFINGGHDWYVWRILLHDFLTRVAFKRGIGPA